MLPSSVITTRRSKGAKPSTTHVQEVSRLAPHHCLQ